MKSLLAATRILRVDCRRAGGRSARGWPWRLRRDARLRRSRVGRRVQEDVRRRYAPPRRGSHRGIGAHPPGDARNVVWSPNGATAASWAGPRAFTGLLCTRRWRPAVAARRRSRLRVTPGP